MDVSFHHLYPSYCLFFFFIFRHLLCSTCVELFISLYRCFNPLHISSFRQWSSSAPHSQRAKYAPISSAFM
jgi:hypothetical protein